MEVGTLKQLGVKPGDVVEYQENGKWYPEYIGQRMEVDNGGGVKFRRPDGEIDGFSNRCPHKFRIISRVNSAPKLWKDMEKGTHVLVRDRLNGNWKEGWSFIAYHNKEGDEREWVVAAFKGDIPHSFELKDVKLPESKVVSFGMDDRSYKITFNLMDGKPDCDSIKMEEI